MKPWNGCRPLFSSGDSSLTLTIGWKTMFSFKTSAVFLLVMAGMLFWWNTVSATEPVPENAQVPGKGLTIKFGTPVMLRFVSDVSTKTVAQGQFIDLEVDAAVHVDGIEVIPAGTPAKGFLISSKSKDYGGIGGRLAIGNFYLMLRDSNRIQLDGMYRLEGADNRTSLFFGYYCCVLGLLVKGDEAIVKEGQTVRAVVPRDVLLQ